VAIAALRSPAVQPVAAEDHRAMMKLRAEGHRELASIRSQVVCRLHAVLCDLIRGGVRKRISAAMAVRLLENLQPEGVVAQARYELACDYVVDPLKVDDQIPQANKHIATAAKASGTTLTKIFGVDPYVVATVKGEVGDISRFKSRDHFAAYNGTAPVEASCSGTRGITSTSWAADPTSKTTINVAVFPSSAHSKAPPLRGLWRPSFRSGDQVSALHRRRGKAGESDFIVVRARENRSGP
jgi:transposase